MRRAVLSTVVLAAMGLGLSCALLPAPGSAQQSCYFTAGGMQRGPYSPSACENWREQVSGAGYSASPCSCSSSSESASPQMGMYGSVAQAYQQLFSNLGAALRQKLDQEAEQAKEKEQLEQLREAQAEREALEARLRQQQKWQQELAELSAEWAGPKPAENEQPFQDMGTNFFGEGGGGRELSFAPLPDASLAKSFSTAADQLRIANCLMKLAAEPGRSAADAKFLNEQAAAAMSGQPVQVDTSGCQPSAPSALAQVQAANAPLTQDQVSLYMKLFDTTNQNEKKTVDLAEQINQLNQAIKKDQDEIQKQQQLVNQLQSAPPVTVAPVGTAPPQPSNALAEAEAALKQAQEAETNDEKAQADAQNQMNGLNQQLKQAQNCFNQAQSDPAKAGALMQSCAQ